MNCCKLSVLTCLANDLRGDLSQKKAETLFVWRCVIGIGQSFQVSVNLVFVLNLSVCYQFFRYCCDCYVKNRRWK